MTLLIFAFTGVLAVIFGVVSILRPKWMIFAIPFSFAFAFFVQTQVVNYVGYALDSSLVEEGREAAVLSSVEGRDWIYYMVKFSDESVPRLVKFPATKANDEESKKKSDGKVIKFTKKKTAGNGAAGAGEPSDGPSFQIIDPQQSETMGKE
jgi:hypothetical protein